MRSRYSAYAILDSKYLLNSEKVKLLENVKPNSNVPSRKYKLLPNFRKEMYLLLRFANELVANAVNCFNESYI